MRKLYPILALFIAALVGLSACSSENLIEQGGTGRGNAITFTIQGAEAANTRATAQPDPTNPAIQQTEALAREKAVSTIYAVLFANGYWFKTIQATGTGTYTVPVDVSGTFDMYLVANPNAALVDKLQNNLTTVDSYEKLVVDQTPGDDNKATNFIMTSAKKTVTTTPSTTVNAGTIKLVRLAARFDLYNNVEKLNITKITLREAYVWSRIARGALNKDMGGLVPYPYIPKTYGTAEGLTKQGCVAAMYSYENAYVGGTSLLIEGDYDGHAIKPTEILLEKLPIKRNHLYKIVLSERTYKGEDKLFDYDVTVKDWEEGETIEWNGAKAPSSMLPSFTASATADLTEEGESNPETLTVTSPAANTITLSVRSMAASGFRLVYTEGTLPAGYSIASTALTGDRIESTQTFTITLPQNTTYDKELPFELRNALDPTVKRDIVLKHKGVRVKMPIEYVADYNVARNAKSFAATRDNQSAGGPYTFDDAVSKFTHIRIDGKPYHLPSPEEWLAVAGSFDFWTEQNKVRFDKENLVLNVDESVKVKGTTAKYTADYKSTDRKIAYAIKFKGNGDTYKCAYRYEVVGNVAYGSKDSGLKITVRLLGKGTTDDINTIANEAYWNSNNAEDVEKYFPFVGGTYPQRTVGYGTEGYYHSTVVFPETAGRTNQMRFGSLFAGLTNYGENAMMFVRLFSDK